MKCITKGKEFCQDFESPVFSGCGTIYIEEKCNFMILSGTGINASMTYENMESNEFTQDKYLLRPFFLRTAAFNGIISLSLNEYEILSKLFMNVDFELSEQPDIDTIKNEIPKDYTLKSQNSYNVKKEKSNYFITTK